jgi:hypothetical protein
MRTLGVLLVCVGLALATGACGSSTGNNPADARPGGDAPPVIDAGPGGDDASCFMNPKTHYEIINACTTADSVDKHPNLPGMLLDGGLPPLP